MDRLEAMAILVRAVEKGSLSGAARSLRMPLPTVSRKVAELETHLKASLVTRSRAGLQLTEAGQSFVASARAILNDVASAERRAAGEFAVPAGQLVVASPIVFGRLHTLPVTADFLASYPNIDVRLSFSDHLAHLLDENIDCAVRIGDLPDSSLTAVRLGDVRRVLCASPAYLDRCGTPRTPRDLERHACITAEALGLPGRWTFGHGKKKTTVPVRTRLSVNTVEAAIDAAIAGAGLTSALSYQVAAAVRKGSLKLLLTGHEPPAWPVHLLHKPQARLPLKLRAYLDFAGPRLRKRLAEARLG